MLCRFATCWVLLAQIWPSSNLSQQHQTWKLKNEAWKNQGFNGIRTRDLRDTGAMLYQLSYEATYWERGQLIEFIFSREEWNDVKFIYDYFIY